MDKYSLNAEADHIWSIINSKQNINKSKNEQIEMIEAVLIKLAGDQRDIGRNQIINNIQDQINALKKWN